MTVWYGIWVLAATVVSLTVASPEMVPSLEAGLPAGLLLATVYWQLVPILMASSGISLDLKRLMVYPVAHRELFGIEVALRVTSAAEMLLITAGGAAGIFMNPAISSWGVLAFVPFVLFNLLFASAMRDLLARLMARKRVREVVILGIVLLSAVPQWLMHSDSGSQITKYTKYFIDFPWPWVATGHLALAISPFESGVALLGWTAAAYWLARRQFEQSLREGPAESGSRERASSRKGLAESLYRIPSRLFPDPLAAMIEKDLRSLSRSPRFRLVFIMGFTFGLLIWLPLGFGRESKTVVADHYLTIAMAYEVLLLGEVLIWNVFGFDRKAVQVYFAMPVKLATVLLAKNLSAVFFIALDAVLLVVMCTLLGLALTPALLGEAAAVTAVISLLLIAMGNMTSFRNPRPVNPDQSWGRGSAGRMQAIIFLIYPIALAPVVLAFLARLAFDTEWAFYGVIAFDLAVAGVIYWIGLESALGTAAERREEIIGTLAHEAGVLST